MVRLGPAGVRLVYDEPDDLRYRYSTVVFAVLVSAAQLAVVSMIARRGRLRQMLALGPPTSWGRVATCGGGCSGWPATG